MALLVLNKLKITGPHRILWLGIALYLLVFGLLVTWKYFNFGYNALDLAIFNQVFYNSSQGHWFASSIHPPSYLGDHLTPILFLLLPLYWLWSSPLLLVLIQTAVLGLCAWPLFLIAKKIVGERAGLVVALTWLLNPFVQNVNLFEFHFLPLAAFFLLWTIYYYQQRRYWLMIVAAFLVLLVREDMALLIFMLGGLIVLDRKLFVKTRDWFRWWLPLTIGSIAYFLLALNIIGRFAVAGQSKFLLYYSWLGDSLGAVALNVALHPWLLLPKIFSLGSLIVITALLLPLAFLPLLRPKWLLLSALVYLQLVTSTGWQWLSMILFTQYSIVVLPGIFVAAIYGLERLKQKPVSRNALLNFLLREQKLQRLLFTVALIYGWLVLGPLPGSISQIAQTGLIAIDTPAKWALVKSIPPDAAVAATYELLTPLSSRAQVSSFNYVVLGQQQFLISNYRLPAATDYLAIDFDDALTYQLQYGNNPFFDQAFAAAATNWQAALADFGLMAFDGRRGLYQRGATGTVVLAQTVTELPPLDQAASQPIDIAIILLGFNRTENGWQLFWQTNQPLEKNYQLQLTLEQNGESRYYELWPLGYGFLPTSQWLPGTIIETNYWFSPTKKVPVGTYEVKIRLVEIAHGGLELNSLRSTVNVVDQLDPIGQPISLGQLTVE